MLCFGKAQRSMKREWKTLEVSPSPHLTAASVYLALRAKQVWQGVFNVFLPVSQIQGTVLTRDSDQAGFVSAVQSRTYSFDFVCVGLGHLL